MNKTYKVVFNKARGVLMVANEITSSVQKKGTKTVMTAVGSALLATATQAAVIDTAQQIIGEERTIENSVVTVENVDENSGTAFYIAENANVTISNTQFKNNTHGNNAGGAIWVYGTYGQLKNDANGTYEATKLNLTNVDFIGNSAEAGGAAYIYPDSFTQMKGGSFVGNKAFSSQGDAYGGALMFKGGKATFEDVVFTDNIAESEENAAMGGAILLDVTRNKDGNNNRFERLTEVTFKVTKDLLYSGNNVISGNPNPSDTYGYWGYTSGGFLFLDRSSKATFDIQEGATLTLGKENVQGHMDSIASAIPQVQDSPRSTLIKSGLGTLLINSSMDYFFSDLYVNEGSMILTKDQESKAHLTVAGGSLTYKNSLTLTDMVVNPDKSNKYFLVGQLDVQSGEVFVDTLSLKTATDSTTKSSVNVAGGTLTVTDLNIAAGSVTVNGGTLDVLGTVKKDKDATLSLSDGTLKANSSLIFKDFGKDTVALNDTVFAENNLTGGSIDIKDFTGEYNLAMLDQLKELTGGASVALRNGQLVDSEATLGQVVKAEANAAGEQVSAEVGTDKKVTVDNGNDAQG